MKMYINKYLIGLSLYLVGSPFSTAAEFQYYLVPLKGITGISTSALKNVGPDGKKYGGMIDEKYADFLFDDKTQQALTSNFSELVAKAYPKAV